MTTTTAADTPLPDLIGTDEVADLCNRARRTPYYWLANDLLPPPDARVSGTVIWKRSTIEEWLEGIAAAIAYEAAG